MHKTSFVATIAINDLLGYNRWLYLIGKTFPNKLKPHIFCRKHFSFFNYFKLADSHGRSDMFFNVMRMLLTFHHLSLSLSLSLHTHTHTRKHRDTNTDTTWWHKQFLKNYNMKRPVWHMYYMNMTWVRHHKWSVRAPSVCVYICIYCVNSKHHGLYVSGNLQAIYIFCLL